MSELPPRRWSDPIGAPQWRMTPIESKWFFRIFVGLMILVVGILIDIAFG